MPARLTMNQVDVLFSKFFKVAYFFSLGRWRENDSVPLRPFPEFDQAQHHQASLVNVSNVLALTNAGPDPAHKIPA